MVQTIVRAKTIVQPGGQVIITDPVLQTGEAVEVLILLSDQSPEPQLSILDVLNSVPGHQLFKSAEEVDHYIREERESWDF
jgi:hypothetical protein